MNQKLPKPMLDAMAREATPADHPSANLLAAFVEQTLTDGEKRLIIEHLARCGECREIVFLASEAAAADRPSVAENARWRWTSRWRWAVPVAAVFVLAAGYLVWQRPVATPAGPEMASRRAAEEARPPSEPLQGVTAAQPSPAAAAPSAPGPPPVAKPRPTTAPAATASVKKAKHESAGVLARNAAAPTTVEGEDLRTRPALPKAAREAPGVAIGGPIANPAPAAPKANGFAATTGEAGRHFDAAGSLSLSVNRPVAGVARTVHPGWRVTLQGHLEHLTPEGWSRVLTEQASVFRVVGVIGSDVWAGGNGGVLFHSGDGGVHWNNVTVAGLGGTETAAIVSIRFDDSQHGVVVTDTGASYATSDGGTTWTKQ